MRNFILRLQNFSKRIILIRIVYPLNNLLYEILHKDYVILTASVKPTAHNWGDDASIKLCELINPQKKYIINRYTWNIFKKNDFLCIGSIITWMTTPKSIIWGSGIVYPERELSAKPERVLAVRGPMTRQYLIQRGIECPEVYGDPALLFPRYYQPRIEKKYKLGIIPHFRDKNNPILSQFKEDNSILIIDVQNVNPWTKFIDDICSCECIASSSLHGIIISDAYLVPNIWVEFLGGERKRFAFKDYLSSVGKKEVEVFFIDNSTTKDQIIRKCSNWRQNVIDTGKLLAECPFK